MDSSLGRDRKVWLDAPSCSLDDFEALTQTETLPDSVPLADEIASRVPIYDAARIRAASGDTDQLKGYMAEWNDVFATGPGAIVIRGAYDDPDLIDAVTDVFGTIIERERNESAGSGDHFAAAGENTRIWNAHEKLCIESPDLFTRYNANPIIPLACRAWLGPLYQITTQVNVVHPGGKAQTCHRDYHMGFQSAERLTRYPARIHALSALLTLQGAVAHCDMPLETGPTKLLPYSQAYLPGYLAALQPDFRTHFEKHHVQLPLAKGDSLFFNPAMFHAAGENRTSDVDRIANLMQIGSGYGRSIEIVDRTRMCLALYPTLAGMVAAKALTATETADVVAGCAEGYPFPANLDIDSPLTGMAPESQQELMLRALNEGWNVDRFAKAIREQVARKRSH